jgi:hypothetical protein
VTDPLVSSLAGGENMTDERLAAEADARPGQSRQTLY